MRVGIFVFGMVDSDPSFMSVTPGDVVSGMTVPVLVDVPSIMIVLAVVLCES